MDWKASTKAAPASKAACVKPRYCLALAEPKAMVFIGRPLRVANTKKHGECSGRIYHCVNGRREQGERPV